MLQLVDDAYMLPQQIRSQGGDMISISNQNTEHYKQSQTENWHQTLVKNIATENTKYFSLDQQF